MTTVYLHIGAHKTGTTALQYFLWNNRKRLRKKGYMYPKLGLGGYSHGILANIIKPNNRDARMLKYRERFRREVLESGYDKIILSSEVFLEGINVAAAVRDFLQDQNCCVRVIVYLRNQADWLESVFHEIVRDPYRRYTGDIFHMREYEQNFHDYDRLLQPWIEQFGDGAVVLCPYDKAKRDGGILVHFLELLGITNPADFEFSSAENYHNVRLHPLASEFLRRVNRFPLLNGEHQALVRDLQYISPYLEHRFGGRFRLLGSEAISALNEKFSDQNRELFRSYSRYGPLSLFENINDSLPAKHVNDNFGPDVQHAVVDGLESSTRSILEDLIPKVKNRRRGEVFLPPPPQDQEMRLNEVIFRQRFELRRLYQMYGDNT